jgi:poly(A) polymerase
MTEPADAPLAGAAWLRASASRRVLQALGAGGEPVRFVGGCVRDGLLGRAPGRELDLATPARPDEVMRLLEAGGLKAIPTGLAHGTVATGVGGQRFEITTLREDVACDGRHAEVAFTEDFAVDAARRDLTINAMSCDPEGRLFDYFDGRTDLAAGRVRFVGRAADRIAEDYLRVLRFFRFFAHYGRAPADPEALAAAAAAAPELARLSGERIQGEMLRLLDAADPLPALRLMAAAGVLAQVIPGPVAPARLAGLLGADAQTDPLLCLAALLRPPPGDAVTTAAVAARWRLSSRDAERLALLTATPLPPLAAPPAKRRRLLHRLGAATYRDLARLADAERPDAAALAAALAAADAWQPQKLPVSGDDLIALGVPPGPRLGALLAAVEDWWVANDFAPDRAACLAQAKSLLAAAPPASPGLGR